MKAIDIANLLNGKLEGNPDLEISNVGKIETAGRNEISFISNPRYNKFYITTNAGALIISNDFVIKNPRNDITIIRVEDSYLSFLKLLELFYNSKTDDVIGISENCIIGENPELGENIYIGDFVKIGDGCFIGDSTKIHSNCTLSNKICIGKNCTFFPNVVVYDNCIIGDNVTIHSGSVVGCDGFGNARQKDGSYKKIPQIGIVVIEDNVEIGSNCSIDRATIGETKICKGVKLDNQIQVAHNVYIGENTAIAAQVGIAGSTKIGKRCMIGGQSGLVGHITICDDVIIGASVGVSKSITKSGMYSGYRSKPHKEDLKEQVLIKQIEKLKDQINKLSRSE
ncbi:MAG: UDP-3-O-(3-hydroxymyristoyl)glucosamine N-acyltransferase [Ignavibacteria bacterium]|nr:UDP-3-O-(3-hydroxymyristoyl)glucosamine N-acyltransferase [Ignavibacteria bacterium]